MVLLCLVLVLLLLLLLLLLHLNRPLPRHRPGPALLLITQWSTRDYFLDPDSFYSYLDRRFETLTPPLPLPCPLPRHRPGPALLLITLPPVEVRCYMFV